VNTSEEDRKWKEWLQREAGATAAQIDNAMMSMNYKLMTENRALLNREEWLTGIAKDLLEALKREHERWATVQFSDLETMSTPMERHQRLFPDCPVCQLIRRAEG